MVSTRNHPGRYAAAFAVVAAIVAVAMHLPLNHAAVGFLLLVAVLLCAAYWGIGVAVFAMVLSAAAFNFFFLPPFGTFAIADPENWIALLAFVVTALVASNLSARARREANSATQQRRIVEHLYALSQRLLMVENVAVLAQNVPAMVRESFGFRAVAIIGAADTTLYADGEDASIGTEVLAATATVCEPSQVEGNWYVPVRVGAANFGAMALSGEASRQTVEAIASLIGVAFDRARAVEELSASRVARESEQLRSALLDSVAHEFRTPLTSIKASVTALISSSGLDNAQTQELLCVIDEETERLNRLVGEAAEMAELDAHAVSLDLRTMRIEEIVEAALEDMRPGKRRIEVMIADGLPPVRADFERAREIVLHLLQNAAKYAPADTPVRVSAEQDGAFVVTQVEDHGPGIEASEQKLIFDRFYRGKRARYAAAGTGMGLAIAKALADAHGGTITVRSEPGAGSVFSLSLPVDRAKEGVAK